MARVWDTYEHYPKLLVDIFKVKAIFDVLQDQQVKEKSNWKSRVWIQWSMLYTSVSSRMRNMTPEQFLNGPNRTKFENQENTEIPGNSVKSGRFRPSKYQTSAIAQDTYVFEILFI